MINRDILERMNKECEFLNIIKRRKFDYLGHLIRGPNNKGKIR